MTMTPSSVPSADVVVVGSVNLDQVVRTAHLPEPGETVLGHDRFDSPGGKGANQAVAAARMGASVAIVGKVGADPAGGQLQEALASAGVDVTPLVVDPDHTTGAAFITVADTGENVIVVAAGANGALGAGDVRAHGDLVARAKVCLLQLEIPEAAVLEAALLAQGTVVLNPAPARDLPAALLSAVDVVVPNEGELAMLVGREQTNDPAVVAEYARSLQVPVVVVTRGAAGALVVDAEGTTVVPAPTVTAVDTTAAGDTFCGALAQSLVAGLDVRAAVTWAVAAGACAVREEGAMPSIPSLAQVTAMRSN